MKRKQTNLYPQLVIGLGASAYFFVLLLDPVLATDMWTKAEDIMKTKYITNNAFFILLFYLHANLLIYLIILAQ